MEQATKYCYAKHEIPLGLVDVMKDFTSEMLKRRPEDLHSFAASFFYEKVHGIKAIQQRKSKISEPNYEKAPSAAVKSESEAALEVSSGRESSDEPFSDIPLNQAIDGDEKKEGSVYIVHGFLIEELLQEIYSKLGSTQNCEEFRWGDVLNVLGTMKLGFEDAEIDKIKDITEKDALASLSVEAALLRLTESIESTDEEAKEDSAAWHQPMSDLAKAIDTTGLGEIQLLQIKRILASLQINLSRVELFTLLGYCKLSDEGKLWYEDFAKAGPELLRLIKMHPIIKLSKLPSVTPEDAEAEKKWLNVLQNEADQAETDEELNARINAQNLSYHDAVCLQFLILNNKYALKDFKSKDVIFKELQQCRRYNKCLKALLEENVKSQSITA